MSLSTRMLPPSARPPLSYPKLMRTESADGRIASDVVLLVAVDDRAPPRPAGTLPALVATHLTGANIGRHVVPFELTADYVEYDGSLVLENRP